MLTVREKEEEEEGKQWNGVGMRRGAVGRLWPRAGVRCNFQYLGP